MKKVILFAIIISAFGNLSAQKGSLLGGGVSTFQFEGADEFEGETYAGQTFYLSYEFLPSNEYGYSGGFEFYKSLGEEINYLDVRLNLGFIMSRKNRIQIPIFFNLGYFKLDGENKPTLGLLNVGAKGGLRFYMTNNFCLEGFYGFHALNVTEVNEESFEDSVGYLKGNNISLGIKYHFGAN